MNPLPPNDCLESSSTTHASQLSNLLRRFLSLVTAEKRVSNSKTAAGTGDTGELRIFDSDNKDVWSPPARSLSNRPSLNTRPSPVRLRAHGTGRRRGGDSHMRIAQSPVQVRGTEAPRRAFRPEARGARPGSAPRRGAAQADCSHVHGAAAGAV